MTLNRKLNYIGNSENLSIKLKPKIMKIYIKNSNN